MGDPQNTPGLTRHFIKECIARRGYCLGGYWHAPLQLRHAAPQFGHNSFPTGSPSLLQCAPTPSPSLPSPWRCVWRRMPAAFAGCLTAASSPKTPKADQSGDPVVRKTPPQAASPLARPSRLPSQSAPPSRLPSLTPPPSRQRYRNRRPSRPRYLNRHH